MQGKYKHKDEETFLCSFCFFYFNLFVRGSPQSLFLLHFFCFLHFCTVTIRNKYMYVQNIHIQTQSDAGKKLECKDNPINDSADTEMSAGVVKNRKGDDCVDGMLSNQR